MTPQEVLKFSKEHGAKFVDLKFMDFPGMWQHFTIPVAQLEEEQFRGRARLRRLVDPRLAGDQRQRHAGHPRPEHGVHRSRSATMPTLTLICNIADPITKRGLHPRPAQHRPQGRGTT